MVFARHAAVLLCAAYLTAPHYASLRILLHQNAATSKLGDCARACCFKMLSTNFVVRLCAVVPTGDLQGRLLLHKAMSMPSLQVISCAKAV